MGEYKPSRIDRSFVLKSFCCKRLLSPATICCATAKATFGWLCPAIKRKGITAVLGCCMSREHGRQHPGVIPRRQNPSCCVCQFLLPHPRKPIYVWEHGDGELTKTLGNLPPLWSRSTYLMASRGKMKQPQAAPAGRLCSGMIGGWGQTWRGNEGDVARMRLAKEFFFPTERETHLALISTASCCSVPLLPPSSLRVCASSALSFCDTMTTTGCHKYSASEIDSSFGKGQNYAGNRFA